VYPIIERDKALLPFAGDIEQRVNNYRRTRARLVGDGALSDFANAHEYYGFHHTNDGWVYREWAPAADALYLTGEFNGWSTETSPLRPPRHCPCAGFRVYQHEDVLLHEHGYGSGDVSPTGERPDP